MNGNSTVVVVVVLVVILVVFLSGKVMTRFNQHCSIARTEPSGKDAGWDKQRRPKRTKCASLGNAGTKIPSTSPFGMPLLRAPQKLWVDLNTM